MQVHDAYVTSGSSSDENHDRDLTTKRPKPAHPVFEMHFSLRPQRLCFALHEGGFSPRLGAEVEI